MPQPSQSAEGPFHLCLGGTARKAQDFIVAGASGATGGRTAGAACRRRCHRRCTPAEPRALPAAQTSCAMLVMWRNAGDSRPERDGHTAQSTGPPPRPSLPSLLAIMDNRISDWCDIGTRLFAKLMCCVLRCRRIRKQLKTVRPDASQSAQAINRALPRPAWGRGHLKG